MKQKIKTLTLEEKLSLLVGGGNMKTSDANGKLPVVYFADGPLGLRSHQDYPNRPRIVNMATGIENPFVEPTAMPALHVLCNSWDPELVALNASSIADDCIDNGVDVLLAPGVNIKRRPLCGRNFEYFSEDPYLTGTMAKAYIEGVQKTGVGTSLKHFCANNSEYDRNAISSEIDERTLREIYLTPFEIALQANPTTVMCSYNLINGVYASENGYLLSEILRGEFGFDGLIVSDWSATHNIVRAVQATLDLTMPYHPSHIEMLRAGYENGELTETQIDERAEKVLGLIEKTKIERRATTTKPERHEIAVKVAKESIVLLKNEDGILPLTGGKLLVAGLFGKLPPFGGGGSSKIPTAYQPPSAYRIDFGKTWRKRRAFLRLSPRLRRTRPFYVFRYKSISKRVRRRRYSALRRHEFTNRIRGRGQRAFAPATGARGHDFAYGKGDGEPCRARIRRQCDRYERMD